MRVLTDDEIDCVFGGGVTYVKGVEVYTSDPAPAPDNYHTVTAIDIYQLDGSINPKGSFDNWGLYGPGLYKQY